MSDQGELIDIDDLGLTWKHFIPPISVFIFCVGLGVLIGLSVGFGECK